MKSFLNLACGKSYINSPEWTNMDYSGDANILHVNLLKPIPLEDESVDFIYCSHFIEHLTKKQLREFMKECFRVLKKGGILRLVTPDFDEIIKAYISNYENKNINQSNFIKLELLDQLVRKNPGGELYTFYQNSSKTVSDEFVYSRTGELINNNENQNKSKLSLKKIYKKILRSFSLLYIKIICYLLPQAFRNSNVSFADVGELHHWVWSDYELIDFLISCGFKNCHSTSFDQSSSNHFKNNYLNQLDVLNNFPRKGNESMYIEGFK